MTKVVCSDNIKNLDAQSLASSPLTEKFSLKAVLEFLWCVDASLASYLGINSLNLFAIKNHSKLRCVLGLNIMFPTNRHDRLDLTNEL